MGKPAIMKPIIVEFLRKHKDMPIRTAARQLYNLHPGVFSSMENLRTNINRVVGKNGKQSREYIKDLVRTPEEGNLWKNYLPRPEASTFEIYKTPTLVDLRYLVIGDWHSPYHDYGAVGCIIQAAIDAKCNAIIALGDMADCYSISRFDRDPRNRNLQYEIDTLKGIFDTLRRAIKPIKFIWKLGNHEDRVEKYLFRKAKELVGLNVMKTRTLFDIDKNIDIVTATNPIRHKALTLIHGDEMGATMVPPVNGARGLFLKANACVVGAHRHTTSEHTETTLRGETITCWSIGCGCDLHPQYAPLNKWNHGFGFLETSAKGEFWKFQNKRIVKGNVV